jgi:hypothetical protein
LNIDNCRILACRAVRVVLAAEPLAAVLPREFCDVSSSVLIHQPQDLKRNRSRGCPSTSALIVIDEERFEGRLVSSRRCQSLSLHLAVALARRPQLLLNLAPSEPVPTARGAERRLQHALPHPRADGAGGDAQPTRDLTAGDQRFVARFSHGPEGRSTLDVIKAVNTIDAIKAINALDAHLRFGLCPTSRPTSARAAIAASPAARPATDWACSR